MFSLGEEARIAQEESILKKAFNIVEERGTSYGDVLADFTCGASILRAIVLRRYGFDIPFTPDFIPLMMLLVIKGSREAHQPLKDTRVDIAGYVACEDKTLEKMEEADRAQYCPPKDKCDESR